MELLSNISMILIGKAMITIHKNIETELTEL
jgi:hypothetical protein